KRLELLREVVPDLRRLAIMANVGNPASVLEMGEAQAAASKLGLEVRNPTSEGHRTCVQGTQGARGCRHSGRTADQVRSRHQFDNCKGARSRSPRDATRPRRRGDRVKRAREGGFKMKLPHRRKFLHLAAGAAALPTVSHFAWAQAYPTRTI